MKFDKKKLQITPASFEEAINLQDAISKALRGNGMNVPYSEIQNKGMEADIDVGGFIDAALSVIGNSEVREALFTCAERAVYNNSKIDRDFFEETEHRGLYYPIMSEVLKENVGPFIAGLVSLFGGLGDKATNYLRQK